MDNEQERARDRLRKAAGNLPDAAAVQVRVGDLLLALKAFDEVEDLALKAFDEVEDLANDIEDCVPKDQYDREASADADEITRLEARIAELERMLGEALLAA